jgi:hypothetical protein
MAGFSLLAEIPAGIVVHDDRDVDASLQIDFNPIDGGLHALKD